MTAPDPGGRTGGDGPPVARTRAELRSALDTVTGRAGSRTPAVTGGAARRRRAVVMTMGALHEGHLSLVRTACEHAEQVVVTVFVNPLQFGPGEDLERYPRDLDRDVALLSGAGADVVFAPTVAEMYPDGPPAVRVVAGPVGERLEGALRPGHFDGVLTVVLKLLHLVAPDVAVFGQKDAQQLMAVRRMVQDLDVDVRVVAAPTVRDEDGLALSSRNAYLGQEERGSALVLSQALRAAERAATDGATAGAVLARAEEVLAGEPGVEVDYVALIDPVDAIDVPPDHRGEAVLAVAGRVGTTRLIDNVVLEVVPAGIPASPGRP